MEQSASQRPSNSVADYIALRVSQSQSRKLETENDNSASIPALVLDDRTPNRNSQSRIVNTLSPAAELPEDEVSESRKSHVSQDAPRKLKSSRLIKDDIVNTDESKNN